MQETTNYFIDQASGTADLTLSNDRFIAKTQGKGALDKLKTIDIPLSDLQKFCLVPTIASQNLVTYGVDGDLSYDSEFIFSYKDGEKLQKKRIFVNNRNESFRSLLETLARKRPDASLLHLDFAEAQKQIGVASARTSILILNALLIGVPILIAAIYIISLVVSGK